LPVSPIADDRFASGGVESRRSANRIAGTAGFRGAERRVSWTLRPGYLALAIGLALQLSRPSCAAEPLSFGVLTAPPYGFEREDKSVSGSNHDIAELIAAKAGLTFTYRLEPLARLISDLQAGRLDLVIMFPGEQTKQFAIAEIMPNNTVVLPKLGNSYLQYADLKGKTIAGLRGAVYDQRFASDGDVVKYDVDSYAMGLRMTRGGRVDGMIGPDFGLYYQMGLDGTKREEFGPPLVLNTRMLCLLGSRTITPEVAARLKAAVEDLRSSGAIAAAAAKYVN
jgi:ABC-type amino acid transport substrate-binding protein